MTFDLSGGILALRAAGQQLHQFYVVPGRQLLSLQISKEYTGTHHLDIEGIMLLNITFAPIHKTYTTLFTTG